VKENRTVYLLEFWSQSFEEWLLYSAQETKAKIKPYLKDFKRTRPERILRIRKEVTTSEVLLEQGPKDNPLPNLPSRKNVRSRRPAHLR